MKNLRLNVVGSNTYGRYSTMSSSVTFNLFESDGWLVPFAGYKKVTSIASGADGRSIFVSKRLNKMIAVVANGVYSIDSSLYISRIGNLESYSGDVYIAENDAYQIAISDKKNIYVYDYRSSIFVKLSLDFIPGYLSFQDGYFISAVSGEPSWRLSGLNNGFSWPAGGNNVGRLQGKPDDVIACVPIPSKMGALFVMGKSIAEHWVNNGGKIFPYKRSSGFNVDYGCENASTIAVGDNFVVWLASSEKSGPVILYSTGGSVELLSNDGINFRLSELKNSAASYAFLFRQDGKLFYVLTFTDKRDNYTLLCDLESKKFYSLCEKDREAFFAKMAVPFNNTYYFIGFNDGNLYELSSKYFTFDGDEVLRARICDTIIMPGSEAFYADYLSFLIEQGFSDKLQCVDMAVSRNSGVSFGNYLRYKLKPLGARINKVSYYALGRTNSFTPEFRFYGFDRFIVRDALLGVSQ